MNNYFSMNRYTIRYDEERIRNAETVADLRDFLCHKTRQDPTVCVSCQDPHCTVGKRVLELMEKETSPTSSHVLAEEPDYKQDPDCDIFEQSLQSGQPVAYMVRNHEFLSYKPKKFTRREALRFLNGFVASYPNQGLEKRLKTEIENEERQDYERTQTNLSESFLRNTISNKYAIRNAEAAAYIIEITEKYGRENAESKEEKHEEKVDKEEKPQEVSKYSDTAGDISSVKLQNRFEKLNALLEDLQYQHEKRQEEIDEWLEKINKAIERLEGMIQEIQKMDALFALLPDVEGDDPQPEEDDEDYE